MSSEGSPEMRRDHLAAGGSATRGTGSRVGEREGAEEADRRVEKGKDVGPGNARSRVRGGGGIEENTSAKLNGIVRKAGEAVPEKPPTARRVGKGNVVRVTT